MKIQHWSIIFLIIIIPFSIVCRSVINKKIANIKDETRYNNIIDNATYDAVSQIQEIADFDSNSKNVPLTDAILNASIDRFFRTLSVNFNLPFGDNQERSIAESYFDRYIPAIIVVGYDGLYVYSCEKTNQGYEFVFKPKIPYTQKIELDKAGSCVINYTLDNYVSLYFPDNGVRFGEGFNFGNTNKNATGTRTLSGRVGVKVDSTEKDPYELFGGARTSNLTASAKFIKNDFAVQRKSDELSYYLYEWAFAMGDGSQPFQPGGYYKMLRFLIDGEEEDAPVNTDFDDVTSLNKIFENVNKDYEYNEDGTVAKEPSTFHKNRRQAIINTIISVMREEFNEHNYYAKNIGITYDFNIPDIDRDEWNNTIDDVSVLAFIQGMPMGTDTYYNNYSLGGARIVRRTNIITELVKNVHYSEGSGTINGESGPHYIYHKAWCKALAGNKVDASIDQDNYRFIDKPSITVFYDDGLLRENQGKSPDDIKEGDFFKIEYKNDRGEKITKETSGVLLEKLSETDARASSTSNYTCWACTECY